MKRIEVIEIPQGFYHGWVTEQENEDGSLEKQITGYGRMTLSEGRTILEGDFIDGLLNGFGVVMLTHINHYSDVSCGASYVGNFVNGKRDGYGKMRYCDGSNYSGNYKNGFKDGEGIMRTANGDSHVGRWVEGRIKGIGEKRFNDGTVYKGTFSENQEGDQEMEDFAILSTISTSADGERKVSSYRGELLNFMPEGIGEIVNPDNDVSLGEFHRGVLNGLGQISFASGDILRGRFHHGVIAETLYESLSSYQGLGTSSGSGSGSEEQIYESLTGSGSEEQKQEPLYQGHEEHEEYEEGPEGYEEDHEEELKDDYEEHEDDYNQDNYDEDHDEDEGIERTGLESINSWLARYSAKNGEVADWPY